MDATAGMLQEEGLMKETCGNCVHSHPTYKGIRCEVKDKKVRKADTCDQWRAKK